MKIKNMLSTRQVIIEYLSSYTNPYLLQIMKINVEAMKVKRGKQKRRRIKSHNLTTL